MHTLSNYIALAGLLILVYLLLRNPSATANAFNALSGLNVGAIGALQGRSVSIPGSVSVSGGL